MLYKQVSLLNTRDFAAVNNFSTHSLTRLLNNITATTYTANSFDLNQASIAENEFERDFLLMEIEEALLIMYRWSSGDIRRDLFCPNSRTILSTTSLRNYYPFLSDKCHIENFDPVSMTCNVNLGMTRNFIQCPPNSIVCASQPNYGHWISDYLPQILLATEHFENIVVLISADVQIECLSTLCQKPPSIFTCPSETTVFKLSDTSIITRVPSKYYRIKYAELARNLASSFMRNIDSNNKVMIDKNFGNIRIDNYRHLVEHAVINGFKLLDPRNLSVLDLIIQLWNATELIIPFSAALPNFNFAPPMSRKFVTINSSLFFSQDPTHQLTLLPLVNLPNLIPVFGRQLDPQIDPVNALYNSDIDFLN